MIESKQEVHDGVCPHCGGNMRWSMTGDDQVDVVCPDCGRFSMAHADFDVQETEVVDFDREADPR